MPSGRRKTRPRPNTGGSGFIRIIGGEWRGRRLPVADAPGLRPSGDRARETLFNWLQPVINGARCADVFAGTGALGFEAASRGAASVVLVERARELANTLEDSAATLGARQVQVVEGDGVAWLAAQPADSLDLVFIDPPFDSDLAARALEAMSQAACLAEGATVYVETARSASVVPAGGLVPVREKEIGEVRMQLLQAMSTK